MEQYIATAFEISRLVTGSYSTSFSWAVSLLEKEKRDAIYAIYGFVRLADEIVDTFHDFDKQYLIGKFESDFQDARSHGISLNPVLYSFLLTIEKYRISQELVDSFLGSMRADLEKKQYLDQTEMSGYIYGSADVVGLMCLRVFCDGNEQLYTELEYPAKKLGTAFQKVNFLRDIRSDLENLDRTYFPELVHQQMTPEVKARLVAGMEADFNEAYKGIRKLPGRSKLATLVAYHYYRYLLRKIGKTSVDRLLSGRIRISNPVKLLILLKSLLVYKLQIV